MAEQEACTALVDEATSGEEPKTPTTPTTSGQLEGESQLLPLLQGLLDAPANDVTPDSGTESGEDQRSNLIAEVQTALDKLTNSLNNDQIDITPERRSSLLQLVSKLQAGLSNGSNKDRRTSVISSNGRFYKKKNKQARHTVGVSKEELADARKLIEQISLNELTPSTSVNKLQLSKQNSESSVPTSSANSSYRNVHKKIKNTTAKPFSSSNSTSSSVHTPTEHFDGFDILFNDGQDLTAHEPATVQQKAMANFASTSKPSLERNVSVDSNVSIKSAYKAIQQAAATKIKREKSKEHIPDDSEMYEEVEEEEVEEEEEEDEDNSNTVKNTSDLENASLKSNPIYYKPNEHNTVVKSNLSFNKPISHEEKCGRFDTQKKLRMKRANTIDIPKPLIFYEDEDDSDSDHEDLAQKRKDSYYALRGPINVSNPHTKKIVPIFEPKTDSDKKFLAFINKHNDNSSNKNSMWANNNSNWGNRFGNIKNTFEKTQDAKNFWKTADDNLKKSSSNQFGPKISRRSARNLQQMFEEKQKQNRSAEENIQQNKTANGHTYPTLQPTKSAQNVPVLLHQANNTKNAKSGPTLQIKSESIPLKQSVVPNHQNTEKENDLTHHITQNVISGKLQVKAPREKNYRVIPQPLPVNQFTHAAQSAFKPIKKAPESPSKRSSLVFSPEGGEIIKSEIKDRSGPSFLYSPKPINSESPTVTSPVGSKPWVAVTGGSRVLSLAASKFEQTPPESVRPKQINKNQKTFGSVNHSFTNNAVDRSPVCSNRSIEPSANIVRKLSGQYENIDKKAFSNYPVKPQTYQVKTSVVESQYVTPQIPQDCSTPQTPQNYSIRYNQPQNYSVGKEQQGPPKYNLEFRQPQNYSIRYDQVPKQFQNNTAQIPSQDGPVQERPKAKSTSQQQLTHQPLNYSIKYDQPKSNAPQPQRRDNSLNTSHQIYQHIPGKDEVKQYTSSCELKPAQQRIPVQPIEPVVQPPKLQRQISEESLHEYNAISSRVMTGPVSQQAVTVNQGPMNRDQHDIAAAFNLKSSLQKIGNQSDSSRSPSKSPIRSPSNSFSYRPRDPVSRSPGLSQSFKYKSETSYTDVNKYKPSDCPKPTVSPSSFRFKNNFEDTHKEAKSCGIVKPIQQPKPTPIYNNTTPLRTQSTRQAGHPSVLTGQFHIPAINVKSPEYSRIPTQAQALSKSDSWHEICMAHQATNQKPVPKPGPVKSKSSHTLAVPKMFEAGMSKEEMAFKRKTMEAFLVGNKSPTNESDGKNIKRSINRIKTAHKVSTQSKGTGGLSRSKTLPDMIYPDLLDESNTDRAFEELFASS